MRTPNPIRNRSLMSMASTFNTTPTHSTPHQTTNHNTSFVINRNPPPENYLKMDELLKLAGNAGMDKPQGEAATGGIMSLLQSKLAGGDFSKILEAIPGAEDLMKKQEGQQSGSGGGMLGGAMSMFGGGKSGSTGNLATLTTMMASQGIDAKKFATFLPMISEFIKTKCGVDVTSILGGTTPATGGEGMFGKIGGMFGKK